MALNNLTLIVVVAYLNWTLAMVMAKSALFTRTALQVIMHPTLNPEGYEELAYKKGYIILIYHLALCLLARSV